MRRSNDWRRAVAPSGSALSASVPGPAFDLHPLEEKARCADEGAGGRGMDAVGAEQYDCLSLCVEPDDKQEPYPRENPLSCLRAPAGLPAGYPAKRLSAASAAAGACQSHLSGPHCRCAAAAIAVVLRRPAKILSIRELASMRIIPSFRRDTGCSASATSPGCLLQFNELICRKKLCRGTETAGARVCLEHVFTGKGGQA